MAIHATIGGRLGQDPELDRTPSGTEILKMSVATDDYRRGEKVTDWIRVILFGRRAAQLGEILRKGSFVVATGKLSVDTWEGRDGDSRTTIEIVASDIELGPKPAGASNGEGRGRSSGSRRPASGSGGGGYQGGGTGGGYDGPPTPPLPPDDEIPF